MTTKQHQTKAEQKAGRVVALPDALPNRSDIDNGERWRVIDAPPIRGACRTNLETRTMNAPDGMGYTEAAIRAHEMTHAAFSPKQSPGKLAQVFSVTQEALEAAEEWRTIAIAERAGVSMAHLTDETEKSTARVIAVRKDWRAAILLTVSTWGTSAQPIVTRTINKYAPPEWKKRLASFRREMSAMTKDHYLNQLGEWVVPVAGNESETITVPTGFSRAVRLARWIDNQTSTGADPTLSREQREARDAAEKRDTARAGRESAADKAARKYKRLPQYSKKGSRYEDVRLMVGDLDERQTGRIATKRTAANVGRKPRRLSRALTDPQRRVFDKRTRTNGGVVVVDMSGSMRLSTADVDAILRAAGGATVIGYSNIGPNKANVWVIAHNGQRASVFPEYGSNNDVDAPALRYGASLRKDKREPFIWVSDGRAYHDGGAFSRSAAEEIDDLTRRHRIFNAGDAEEAVRELERCARGNRSPMKPSVFVTRRLTETE